MKITSLMVALVLTLATLSVRASDKTNGKAKDAKPAPKAQKAAPAAAQKPVEIAMTGSYLKQPIQRNGLVTDGANPVVVLSRKAIENSGAADLRELLVMRGIAR